MGESIRARINSLVGTRQRFKRYVALLVAVALVVATYVTWYFMDYAVAMTHVTRILDCHVASGYAHTHNVNCFNDDGELVCQLPEVALHTHTDACYDESGKLVCELPEVTKEHVHGPGCFVTVTEAKSETSAKFNQTAAKTADAPDPNMPEQVFERELQDKAGKKVLTVSVVAPEGALPSGAKMAARLVANDQFSAKTQAAVEEAVAKSTSGRVDFQQAVDITFYTAHGREVEPAKAVTVTLSTELMPEDEAPVLVHVDDLTEQQTAQRDEALINGKTLNQAEPMRTAHVVEALDDKALKQRDMKLDDNQLAFESSDFSTYVLTFTTLRRVMQASDGLTYTVTVDAPASAGVPGDAELQVSELMEYTRAWYGYTDQLSEELGADPEHIRLFDISILSNGIEIQPYDYVNVGIALDNAADLSNEIKAVHFAEDGLQVLEASLEGDTVNFEAESFSVYAIVDAPAPAEVEITSPEDLEELSSHVGEGFYLALPGKGNSSYFSSNINGGNCFIIGPLASAATWYFESAGATNKYYLYTYVDNAKRYVKNTSGNLVGLVESGGTVFEMSQASNGYYYAKIDGQNKWLQYSNGGGGIRFWTDKNNAANSQIGLTYVSSYTLPDDTYGLDGKTYGIAYHNDTSSSSALMSEAITVSGTNSLKAVDMLMRPDVLDNEGILLVSADSDIAEWTFQAVEGDTYYLTTRVNGQVKYLTLTKKDNNNAHLTLEDEPTEGSVIKAQPGTEANTGKYQLTALGYAIVPNLSTNAATNNFYGGKLNSTTSWLNLVEKSVLGDEDFNQYSAKKVSISDTENVYDGQQVVIYTRIWNDTTKRYEFYVVDHDGTLARCYDTGDGIEWIGSKVNTALWSFTEYTYDDGSSTHYYELQNVQYGNFIAPQATGGQVMADSELGINLNGRRYGENYTTILAWDDANYAYTGLKTQDGSVVTCSLSEAEDFYFAVVNPVDMTDELSEVKTIDGAQYGITMKMVDFNNKIDKNRDTVQTAFFGYDSNVDGLLSTNLGEDGYPTITATTAAQDKQGLSLSELFKNMTDANHLFIESIYNESGYFEYDSTSNFAHLNADGTFTVYDQLAATGVSTGKTRTHGQFMPYNQIVAGKYAYDDKGNPITNQTDVLARDLPDINPRKGEQLYSIPANDADYFFGMEMSASFTQTADGLDAWGHDIIFEFSGDDDFWFYVDGELVLDLGGVHSAMTGSVNFRTGEVTHNKRAKTGTNLEMITYTLRDVFESNYRKRNPKATDKEVADYLADIFVEKTVDGKKVYVFDDYSNHDMKIFYMERGSGASNLHMRFNLAAVRPGTFTLSKKLSGTESASNSLIEFPYQILYYTRDDGETTPHVLGAEEGEASLVTYIGTNTSVTYKDSFTPAGGSQAYEHVFFLKPGEKAEVDLPDNAESYDVVECGVNPDVYDHVVANGHELPGTATANTVGTTARRDYAVGKDTLAHRSEVEYTNHVADGAMRTLTLSKGLYGEDGDTRLTPDDNDTTFTFRLYLGTENAQADDLPLANMYEYCVRDPRGTYCRWNATTQKFISVGKKNYDALTDDEKVACTFHTSINGSISKIPADHVVEVRDLIVGTQFMVEERDSEIPKGYTLRLSDGYTRLDAGHESQGYEPINGVIEVDNDPKLEVRNQKGWGLTADKVWTDSDFMAEHDPIYFAVYVDGELRDGTVRQLTNGQTSIYYFFQSLEGKKFEDYVVREVTLTTDAGQELTVDAQGVVSGYASVTPIADNGTLTIGGKPVGGQYSPDGYVYDVSYEQGEMTDRNENVRVDTVTNSRPGIKLRKTSWANLALSGAKFTLVDSEGNDVAAALYTSRKSDGLITIAYLSPGTYTLTEVAAPKGFVVLEAPMTITVGEGGEGATVTVEGVDEAFYTVSGPDDEGGDPDMAAVITIRNRPAALQAKKVDASSKDPLAGAHFALYRQVSTVDGTRRKDYNPMPGYANIVTDENGKLPGIDMNLGAGTYYLTETTAPEGYDMLTEDICFTIGSNGVVSIEGEDYQSWLTVEPDPTTGNVTYSLNIPNGKMKKVSFNKVDIANTSVPLAGAVFDLYRVVDGEREEKPIREGMTSGEDGLLAHNNEKVFALPLGTYQLIETAAPDGYLIKEKPIDIIVTFTGISYDEGTSLSQGKDGVIYDEEAETYLLLLTNTGGFELPATGGTGVGVVWATGIALLCVGAALAWRSRPLEER